MSCNSRKKGNTGAKKSKIEDPRQDMWSHSLGNINIFSGLPKNPFKTNAWLCVVWHEVMKVLQGKLTE